MKIIMNMFNMIPFILVGIDTERAKEIIRQFTSPAYAILLWAVPICGAIACGVVGVHYLMMDTEERDQRKGGFIKQCKTIALIVLVVESLVVIASIFGITLDV